VHTARTSKENEVVISLTASRVTSEQAKEVDDFLHGFLPRLQREPGVVAIYHFYRPEPGESTTIVVWESDEARQAYRQSALIEEAIGMERRLGLSSTREAYLLSFASRS
jgi:heme-degrading monooxygenase HmoA